MNPRAEIGDDFLKQHAMNRIVIDNKDARKSASSKCFQFAPRFFIYICFIIVRVGVDYLPRLTRDWPEHLSGVKTSAGAVRPPDRFRQLCSPT
jgi:hypothetical protein